MLWISWEISFHILVDFFLEVDSRSAVRPDDLISAHARVLRNVAARIRNANVSRVVTHSVMRSFLRGGDQLFKKFLAGGGASRLRLCYGESGNKEKSTRESREKGAVPDWSAYLRWRIAHTRILLRFDNIAMASASG